MDLDRNRLQAYTSRSWEGDCHPIDQDRTAGFELAAAQAAESGSAAGESAGVDAAVVSAEVEAEAASPVDVNWGRVDRYSRYGWSAQAKRAN